MDRPSSRAADHAGGRDRRMRAAEEAVRHEDYQGIRGDERADLAELDRLISIRRRKIPTNHRTSMVLRLPGGPSVSSTSWWRRSSPYQLPWVVIGGPRLPCAAPRDPLDARRARCDRLIPSTEQRGKHRPVRELRGTNRDGIRASRTAGRSPFQGCSLGGLLLAPLGSGCRRSTHEEDLSLLSFPNYMPHGIHTR